MADPYRIALWRYEQIALLVDPDLTPSLRRKLMREKTTHAVTWPQAETQPNNQTPTRKPIARSTLKRWIQRYKDGGYQALLPRTCSQKASSPESTSHVCYALGLLVERPSRSLRMIHALLKTQFPEFELSVSSLHRKLQAQPTYDALLRHRKRRQKRLFGLYEAHAAHECWQIDGKGPFVVRFHDTGDRKQCVLTVLDDYTRFVVGALVSNSESEEAAITLFQKTAARWGLPTRIQFDRGSAFESHAFREGLAQCGIHRNFVEARSPESQGKIEAYHRFLGGWFVDELREQEVRNPDHLQELLDASLSHFYNAHDHRSINTTPEKRLAGRLSKRTLSVDDLARAFYQRTRAKAHAKTGEVALPNGVFRVPVRFAGRPSPFLYDPIREHAFVETSDGRQIKLEPFRKKPLPAPRLHPPSGQGELQKILDLWRGQKRPNTQPHYGLPELFLALAKVLERPVPQGEKEASTIASFWREHGPLPRKPFERALQATVHALGNGRPLDAYLDHLKRQINRDQRSSKDEEVTS